MTRKLIALCLTLLLLCMATVPVFAASGPAGEAGSKVRLGFFEFGGMFEGAGEGERKSGFCYEYMMQVSVYTGWTYEFVYGSYAELYEMLKNGEIDVLPYTNYNEQRGNEVLFSDMALVEEEYYIALMPGAEGAADGIDEMKGKSISTLIGADYNSLLLDYIEENGLDIDVRYYPSLDETWEAVRNGTVDATVFTSNAYDDGGWNCLCTFGKKPTYIAVAKERPELLSQLNNATELIETENPALRGELYASYFSDNPMRRSLSAEELQWAAEHPVIHVGGFTDDWSDLHIDGGTAEGLTVDVIGGIIEELNINLEADYRCYDTLDEMRAALDRGEVDVVYPFYPDPYIAQQYDLDISATVRVATMELVYRTDTSYGDALSRIATPATRLGIFFVRDVYPDSEIIGASSVKDSVDRVRSGEALGAIAYTEAIHGEAEKYGNLNYMVLTDGCGTCFAAKKGNHALIMMLNRGLNYFDNAEISALLAKHMTGSSISTRAFLASHREVLFLLVIIVAVLVALVLALLQMSRLRKKADEANKAKSSFLFNMSHDIRTPMNAITGFTDKAIRHRNDPEVLEETLDKVKSSSEYLLRIINDILDMAKIESGTLELKEKLVNVDEGHKTILDMFGGEAARKGIDFHTSFRIRDNYLWFDGDRMLQIISNLLSNAVKYTNPGGEIRYSVEQLPCDRTGYGTFVITVEDTGCGMSPDFLEKIFDPFERELSATKSGAQGTGLGMSIVKRLADAMGSRLEVRSEQGKGTVIRVISEHRFATPSEIRSYHAEADRAAAEKAEIDFSGRRVLLVEDNEMNREIAADILEEEGLAVETAADGTIAVDLMREKGPDYYDFILMDIQMPLMNGFEATAAIRQMYPDARIPIIALSANAFAEDRAASLAAGMDDHVAKPINVKELFSALSRFL